jgi:hypothetical protein
LLQINARITMRGTVTGHAKKHAGPMPTEYASPTPPTPHHTGRQSDHPLPPSSFFPPSQRKSPDTLHPLLIPQP